MIKPKHYGLATSVAAVLITLLPACVFVLIGRSPLLDERRADSTPSVPLQELIESAAQHNAVEAQRAHVPTATKTAPVPLPFVPLPVTGDTYSAPLTVQTSDPEAQTVASAATIRDSTSSRSSYGGSSGWGPGNMDLTERVASSDIKAIKPSPVDPVPTPVEPPPSERIFPPPYEQMPSTVSEATGHQLQSSSMAGDQAMSSDLPMASANSTAPKKGRLKKRATSQSSSSLMAAAMDQPTEEESYVEMILKTPIESRRTRRVENVLAFTNESGWPIAMVCSDLPDSRWWVQQMTAIRGNAFSARVNFGNETSIAGSKYHLVFVFLESQDEVRRFNIAKQFKEIPAGVRRSRKYTFVRK